MNVSSPFPDRHHNTTPTSTRGEGARGVTSRRALPGDIIDLVHCGPPARDLAARGDRAVHGALVSIAMSALQRGWTLFEYKNLVLEPKRRMSQLVRMKNGRDRGEVQTITFLEKAWGQAARNVAARPGATRADLALEAERRHLTMEDAADALAKVLHPSDHRILMFIADRGLKLGAVEIACSRRMVMEALGLGHTAVENGLDRLEEAGLLSKVSDGRPAGPRSRQRIARKFALPAKLPADLTSIPENRDVAPDASSSGAPASGAAPEGGMGSGAPSTPGSTSCIEIDGDSYRPTPEIMEQIRALLESARTPPD